LQEVVVSLVQEARIRVGSEQPVSTTTGAFPVVVDLLLQ